MCAGCAGALRDSLRGIAVLAALGGLAALLLGLHSLLPLGSTAFDPSVSWFALLLFSAGLILVLLGGTAGLGFAGPIHCVSTPQFGLHQRWSGLGNFMSGTRARGTERPVCLEPVRSTMRYLPPSLVLSPKGFCLSRATHRPSPSLPPQFTGASLALLPLSTLLVWAYVAHSKQLRWLADRDQTFALTAILDWVGAHLHLAAGLAGFCLLLQAAAVLLGALYACAPAGRRHRHPW